ncbi:hypothetical protein BLA60_28375 [Actinophytocola xinjiangensis]|uniref:HTH cro/C1-type domain-containing protein n=1 Tax=Actinophytocola xinjiangensis TaxID=485602 RepID=A0A7Z0WH91_9PSEU|nr:helix-turn-helix transcriptional regulator [Actinophytocola xinjiangensis]OLF07131.1 hypothetical protein BLA60_28375 [Actinophytocola xinjiangensis]
MARRPTPTIRRWQLGQELRRLREQAGVTPTEAARYLEVSQATLSKIESGKQQIKPLYVKLLASLYGVPDDANNELLQAAAEANQPEWYVALASQVPKWFRQYLGYEGAAAMISTYSVELIDGLLQTEEYARAVGLANQPDASGRDLDAYVALRRARQARVDGDDPPMLHAVLNEASLRTLVGGPEVMRDQLRRLAEVADQPHVTIQVLPFNAGAHPAMTSPFTLLGFDIDEMATVYLENGRGAVYLDAPSDLDRYRWMFDRLTTLALPPANSIDLLSTLVDDL